MKPNETLPVVAFPESGQPNYGTRNCTRLARDAGITVHEITA